MRATDLVDELRRLPLTERLTVLEMTLHEIREELGTASHALPAREFTGDEDQQLREAALIALPLYEAGDELTAFTALDSEPFHDYEAR